MDKSETKLFNSLAPQREKNKWDVFENPPVSVASSSTEETKWIAYGEQFGKILAYILTFIVILGGAVVSKGSLLFMTSQLNKAAKAHCNETLDRLRRFTVSLPQEERIVWMWILLFTYFVPQVGSLLRSLRILLFKSWRTPSFKEFVVVFLSETCSTIGNAILIFVILPRLDVMKGVMLTNGLSFTPAVLLLSRTLYGHFGRSVIDRPGTIKDLVNPGAILKLFLDVLSILIQATVFFVWPLIEDDPVLWCIPAAALLISCGWWENFTLDYKKLRSGFLRDITKANRKFTNSRYFSYMIVSMWKCVLFFSAMIFIEWRNEGDVSHLFYKFSEAFSGHQINITEVLPVGLENVISTKFAVSIDSDYLTPVWLFIISFCATYLCYAFGKFASKVYIQDFSYALPISFVVPVTIAGFAAICGFRNKNPCFSNVIIPSYLFFNVAEIENLRNYIGEQYTWIWLFWLLSQVWITRHIWRQKNERLGKTERLYVRPMYEPFVIDQDLAMNRRILDEPLSEGNKPEDLMIRQTLMDLKSRTDRPATSITEDDSVTRIYACGTMWHETKEEMVEFLKSILRLDEDQCARRIVKAYLDYPIPDYYELETHILFDDAFERVSQDDPDPQVNRFVKHLLEAVNEATLQVHEIDIIVRPPVKQVTPYGGKLVWTLPGKTKLIAHLKDKKKIRAKKRWSQIMYMFYLLGHRLMEREDLDVYQKTLRASNTYFLALDGDIDFQPKAVHLLVDLMKNDISAGAACGRIHPVGNGPIVWCQMFEYAIGHWMQKATEHVIGSVLCSPGCFSLFRGSALMDLGVMKKYATKSTEALHYLQCDQGEDRWLSTLLMQRGYRIKYTALSDAYTHCPESFNEFFHQRRRWVPSAFIANVLDLLINGTETVKINDNMSRLYLTYHFILMVASVFGPGTVFLVLVSAFGATFQIGPWPSLLCNMIPIIIFIVTCTAFAKDKTQLLVAGILSCVYSLIMVVVLVGIVVQMITVGVLAPSSIFFFFIAGQMIIAALLHPKEFNCLKYGLVFYVTLPCMYLILVIYSVFNFNNVSWGTREVISTFPQAEVQNNNSECKDKKSKRRLKILGSKNDDDDGGLQFALGNLFKCFCFTGQNTSQYNQNREILARLEAIEQQLKVIEEKHVVTEQEKQEKIDDTQLGEPEENSDATSTSTFDNTPENFPHTSWLEDEMLQGGKVEPISNAEEEFWRGMLDLYLCPIDNLNDKHRITADLKALRDKAAIGFLMLNAIFVLTLFLLTLKSDVLHIKWPLEVKTTFTYVQVPSEVRIYKEYLKLEPIGVVLIFFASLLLIQFISMLIHRFQMFSQIVSKTNLNFTIFQRSVNKLTEKEIVEMHPVKFVGKLQKLKGADDSDNEDEQLINARPARRSTIYRLQKNLNKNKNVTHDLEEAFRKRTAVAADNRGPLSKTIVDIIMRRKTIVQNRRSMDLVQTDQHPLPANILNQEEGQINYSYSDEGMEV